jgi:hypothetical protein
MQYLSCKAQENIKTHLQRIPKQYEECHMGLKMTLRRAWEISNNSTKTTEVLQALSLCSDTYGKIMDLTTDGTTLQQAMDFISKKKGRLYLEDREQTEPEVQSFNDNEEPAPVEPDEVIEDEVQQE